METQEIKEAGKLVEKPKVRCDPSLLIQGCSDTNAEGRTTKGRGK